MSTFNPITPVQFALKIREMASDSWWVYRHEMGQQGFINPVPRIVFYAQNEEAAQAWVEQQRRTQEGCVILVNN